LRVFRFRHTISLMFVTKNHIRFKASRAHGPGGQNVDHRSTKVHAWVHITDLPLDKKQQRIVREKLKKHINHDDELWAECQEERSQEENREHVVEHLNGLISGVLKDYPPRIPTEPTRKSKEERLHNKHHHGQIKQKRHDGHLPHGNF
jgi:ribosome-associated protein